MVLALLASGALTASQPGPARSPARQNDPDLALPADAPFGPAQVDVTFVPARPLTVHAGASVDTAALRTIDANSAIRGTGWYHVAGESWLYVGDGWLAAWHADCGGRCGALQNGMAGRISWIGDSLTHQGGHGGFAAVPAWSTDSLLGQSDWSTLPPQAQPHPDCAGMTPLFCEVTFQQPELAIILIGTNDPNHNVGEAEYREQLGLIVAKLQTAGAQVVLNTIPASIWWHYNPYNAIVRQTANAYQVPLIHLNEALTQQFPDQGWLVEDGVHFTPEAYAYRDTLTQAFLQRP